jgi:transposase InsO family protein
MNVETKLIKSKLGLLKLAEKLGNVSEACQVYGYSRDSFYRIKELYETGGSIALKEVSRRKPNYKNRIDSDTEQAVVSIAYEQPALGQLRVSNELRKKGIFVSPCGVRCVWQRHDLETFPKRLKAMETKVFQDGGILTEAQMIALERKREKKEATGEIETAHPGYLGAQDTYYVGNIKGVGRIYQQTFIDTYSKVAIAKLYDRKNAITAADTLNDAVLPFFEEQQIPLLRILTDRGTEYCGKPEYHEYELYLQIEGIEHSKTKARSPQTNGICERFHRTIQDEFYAIAFRKKLYTSIDEMQKDLDQWLDNYNHERTHSGKYCYGKTPMQTFMNSKHLALEKRIDELLEKDNNFEPSAKTETGSAAEQPARHQLTSENNKVVEQSATSFQNYFLRNA